MTAPVLLYVHVPKCGGQTLSSMMGLNFPRSRVLRPQSLDKGLEAEMATIDPSDLARADLIWGHYHYGLHRWLDRPYRYATMVRDPIARVESLYNYARRVPEHPLHRWIADEGITLEQYVERDVDHNQLDNGLVRQLVGMTDGEVGRAELEQAMRNLDEFTVVGLTERFDESFVLFRRRLGLRMPFYVTRNVSHPEPGAVRMTDRVRAMLVERNALDLELVAHARRLFEQQVAEEGPALPRGVRRLRRLNRMVERLDWAVDPVGARVARRLFSAGR